MQYTFTPFRVFLLSVMLVLSAAPSFAAGGKKGSAAAAVKRKAYQDFDEAYYSEKSQFNVSTLDVMRAKAKGTTDECDAQQRYIDYLSPNDLNKLPIGFKKEIGNVKIKIAIASAVFTPRYAELTAYAKVDIPQNNNGNGTNTAAATKSLYFGISGLKLSKDGGIIGDARLVLLGDYAIKLGGNNASLILKGSMDMATGAATSKTYVNIDCNGFREFGLAAAVEFPRSLLEPINAQGDVIPTGQVRGEFSTVVSNWNDILVDINLPAFQVKGIDGVGIQVSNAVVDLSDFRNSSNVAFPAGYQQKYIGSNAQALPLWRGVYAKTISVTLPKSFANRQSNERVSFGAENLIIDNNGLTGLLYAENILKLHQGSAGGWQFSVDSMRIAIEANRLLRAGFGGRLGLPVNKTVATESEAGDSLVTKNRYLAYTGVFTSVGDYLCRVITKDSVSFDVWKARVLLLPESYVELKGNRNSFKPNAMLSGSMTINSKTSTSGNERSSSILDFKGVTFTNLNIKTEAPYITAQYFGFNGSVKLGILPVSVDSVGIRSYAQNELGIAFNLKVGLQDNNNNPFAGSTRLSVIGRYQADQGLARWSYQRLEVGAISINAEIGKMRLRGSISFMDDHPVYGDGFNGNIALVIPLLKDSLTVTAAATFGNKGFRYWFVDGTAEFSGRGIPLGALNINGFGGGAYYRMKKNGYDPVQTPTGFEYVPDSTAGLGLRASVFFNVASEKLDQGQATFEMAFNRGGGLRFIGLYGFAKFQSHLNIASLPGGSMLSFIKNQYKAVEDKMKNLLPDQIEALAQKKVFNPTEGAKEETEGLIPTSFQADMRAVVGISYDFNNKTLHANFEIYINTPGNILTGVGEGGRAGWAVLHISPEKWYLHMGTPVDPIGVKIAVGPLSVQTGSYFMLGHDLPAFPALPGPLQAVMAQNNITYQSNLGTGEKGDIQDGKGIAFGASVHVSTGDINFLILYANFSAGLGFDVMVKDYSNYYCSETGQTPGFDGWYAKGRVYAYLQGEAGIRIKLGPFRKRIPIIKAAAVAILEARLPKPTWFGGLFAVRASILGGKISVSVNLKLSFGSECTLVPNDAVNGSGNIDFDDFKVITAATPSDNTDNVSVYARPEFTCSTKPNQQFTIPADNDSPEEVIRPYLSSIEITKGGVAVGSAYKISQDGSKITVYPDSGFSPLSNYVMTARITYQRLVSNTWVTLTDNGAPATETTTVNFKTGETPPYIADDNIGFMYPYKQQRFYYKDESKFGRVLLTVDRTDLFSSFRKWKARFFDLDNNNQLAATTDVTYTAATKLLTFPTGLPARQDLAAGPGYEVLELPTYKEVSMENYERTTMEANYVSLSEATLEEAEFIVPEERVDPEFIRNPGGLGPAPMPEPETVPFLLPSRSYRVEIYGVGYVPSTLVTDTTKSILTIDFRTSQYGTLAQKINALQIIQPIIGRVESDVIDLQAKVANYEGFDVAEIVPTTASGNYPLIVGEAALDEDGYYNNQIKNLVNYPGYFFPSDNITVSRLVSELGIIPYRAISTSNFYLSSAQSSTYSPAVNDRFPFIYDVNRIFNLDFTDLRTKIINRYLSNLANPPQGPMYEWVRPRWYLPKVAVLTQEWRDYFNSPAYQQSLTAGSNGLNAVPYYMRNLIISPFPFMPQGTYKAKFSLRLPISWSSTPGEFNYGNSVPGVFNYINPIQ